MAKKSFSISQTIAEGLSNSIKTVSNHKGELNYEMMSIHLIEADPENPRKLNLSKEDLQIGAVNLALLAEDKKKQFEALMPLIDSIKKVGVRNAIEVYKYGTKYRLISGERRWLASLAAEREYIPVHICDKPNTFDLRYLQWIENIQREDLSLWEKYQNLKQLAEAYNAKHPQHAEITVKELSQILGTSERQSYRYFTLIRADSKILQAIQMGKINNLKLLEEIAGLKDAKTRQAFIDNLDGSSSRGIIKQIKEVKNAKAKNKLRQQGQSVTKINLGFLENPATAQAVFNMLIAHEKLSQFKPLFAAVDWSSTNKITQAFRKIFGLIEKNVVEQK